MGFGDAIMASALARGLHEHGMKAAFGVCGKSGPRLKWTGYCEEVFTGNPNIAYRGQETQANIIWLPHYKDHTSLRRRVLGYGDEIIGTGLARGMKDRGKLAAFGNGQKILWGPWCEEMFANNPNIARPGSEQCSKLEWIPHYKGARMYNKLKEGKWVWNYDFKVTPGEFFFDEIERRSIEYARQSMDGFVVIEPNVPWQKTVAPNKDWGEEKYQKLTQMLLREGIQVVQFIHKNSRRRLRGVTSLELHKFREAIALLSLAKLYIGPEGGMHHAAAALNLKAVVIMGGFIPPAVVGYVSHINLTGGAEACGNIHRCSHCEKAMQRITVAEVHDAAMGQLQ